ncbi:hypothetical protein M0M57_06320 [Flavobacterium azooxidireducens]|uniref:Mrr-like domain-containing protein n=1 Tax=Flavobacterium azooxidireducens TaxID=1871076 RepID=A0ABY4KIF5_9FLAO|nr:hypothetical protein [Flavobacterium azooxidireducens]UPQ80449.1 hypothetical protein M0M57_06320 [Flavobacterium azooxidireducens]
MKKTVGKPENWQDFELLCKKLWGEVWDISSSIKKNGRLGQEQAGVDVYGIPKNKNNYWGIQCKGKDDYTNAKLTKAEIDKEIDNAKNFKPKLETYIIATTANKDAKIEEYVRIKDFESRKNGMEIHLFCWEDIVDLLEEYNDVYNWYLSGIGQKDKFDFTISFNDFQKELTLKPIFEKNITKYILTKKSQHEFILSKLEKKSFTPISHWDLIRKIHFPSKVNKSWCDFEINLENSGKKVIEDWKFKLKFIDGIRHIFDEFESIHSTSTPLNLRKVYVSDDKKSLTYYPLKNEPLIQKDYRIFDVSILPKHEINIITVEWELLARDFNTNGKIEIHVIPEYIEKVETFEVMLVEELIADKVIISDHVIDTVSSC